VADIFREVDEEVRREKLKQIWDRYGNLIVAAAILVVLGVAGWRGYQWYEAKKAAEASAAFSAAAQLAEQGKHAEAEAAFARVVAEGTSGYRILARLREAAEKAELDGKAAVTMYDSIAGDSSAGPLMRDLASLRAAFLLVDSTPLDEMTRRLEPLAQPNGAFRHSARELLALSAWRTGDAAASKRWSEAVIGDPEAPTGIRARVEVLMALLTDQGRS
jgi:hypothetical protein